MTADVGVGVRRTHLEPIPERLGVNIRVPHLGDHRWRTDVTTALIARCRGIRDGSGGGGRRGGSGSCSGAAACLPPCIQVLPPFVPAALQATFYGTSSSLWQQ